MNTCNGTYDHCSQCKTGNCCTDFNNTIDNIIVTVDEKSQILSYKGIDFEKYFSKIPDSNAYHLHDISGTCPFYQHSSCSIYSIRPADCRLFPYDIMKSQDGYYLIRYDLPCGTSNVSEILEEAIKTLCSIIDTYTDTDNVVKVSQLPYSVIKKLDM